MRKLVDETRRANSDRDRSRAARDAAYHFMSAMAGDLADFEEAAARCSPTTGGGWTALIAGWPDDIRDHIVKLVERI